MCFGVGYSGGPCTLCRSNWYVKEQVYAISVQRDLDLLWIQHCHGFNPWVAHTVEDEDLMGFFFKGKKGYRP